MYPDDDNHDDYGYYEEEPLCNCGCQDGCFDDYDDEPPKLPEPLGTLSKGPVRVACPEIIYADYWLRLGILLQCLTLAEARELVEFLHALPTLCEIPECRDLTGQQILEDMAFEAYRRRAYKVAREYRARLDNPATFDEWCILPPVKKRKAEAQA